MCCSRRALLFGAARSSSHGQKRVTAVGLRLCDRSIWSEVFCLKASLGFLGPYCNSVTGDQIGRRISVAYENGVKSPTRMSYVEPLSTHSRSLLKPLFLESIYSTVWLQEASLQYQHSLERQQSNGKISYWSFPFPCCRHGLATAGMHDGVQLRCRFQ